MPVRFPLPHGRKYSDRRRPFDVRANKHLIARVAIANHPQFYRGQEALAATGALSQSDWAAQVICTAAS